MALIDLPWLDLKVKYAFDLIYKVIPFLLFKGFCFETVVVFQTLEVIMEICTLVCLLLLSVE
jgi:hypothetical protein